MPALISIIVPIFNVEDYLQKCLESISEQSYPLFECLLVDDGSTDHSADICKRFCENDSRFCFLHQEKKGASAARNMGLDAANGDYILFVDGDDYLFPEALQIALSELVSCSFDWMMFNFIRANRSDASLPDFSNKEKNDPHFDRLDCNAALHGLLDSHNPGYCVVWNKLYTKRIIGKIRFKNVSYAEDVLFNYEVFRQTRLGGMTTQYLYFWRIRNGSLTSVTSPERFLSQFKSLFILEDLSRNDETLIRGLCLKKIYRQILITRYYLMETTRYSEFFSLVKEMKHKTFREYLSNKSVTFFEKTRILLLLLCPHLMKAILKALGN